jgi:type IV pilus assembly protein PilW
MRVIGGQLRQASSLYLNLGVTDTVTDPIAAPVSIEIKAGGPGQDEADPDFFNTTTADGQAALLNGQDGATATDPDTLTIGFRRYVDPVFVNPNPAALTYSGVIPNGAPVATLARNCKGGIEDKLTPDDTISPGNNWQVVRSIFSVSANATGSLIGVPQLRCAAFPTDIAQPIVSNVANFKVRYLVQSDTIPPTGQPRLQYMTATQVDTAQATGAAAAILPPGQYGWGAVRAIEVCLVLYGNETKTDLPTGTGYVDCDGTTQVDITALSGERKNRTHLVFRSVFQTRSMGRTT